MSSRGVLALVVVLLAMPLTAVTATGGAVAAVAECPSAYPVTDVRPGLLGTGTSVFDASGQRTFTAEVVGVLEGATRPGGDLVLVELSGPVIDAGGGAVPFGLSGAPVMVGGRLLGAVAWGVTWGPSTMVGLTPGQDIIDLAGLDVVASGGVSAMDRVAVTAKDGGPAELAPLSLPLQVSGVSGTRLRRLGTWMGQRGFSLLPVQGAAAVQPSATTPVPLQAGDGLGGVLSYGDVTSAALGAVSYVCDGVAVGFGHPLTYWGSTTIGATALEPIALVPDPLYGPVLLSRLAGSAGTITQDRWAGIRAELGPGPTAVPVRTTLLSTETGRSRAGRSDVITPDELPWIAQYHLASNLDVVADRFGAGGAALSYVLRGTAGGTPWMLERGNRFVSTYDIAWDASTELLGLVARLAGTSLAPVTVTAITATGSVTPNTDRYVLEEVLVGGGAAVSRLTDLEVVPGDRVNLRLRLRGEPDGVEAWLDLPLRIPEDAPYGSAGLEITGGPGVMPDPYECLWGPCPPPEGVDALGELVAFLENTPRNDDVVARLSFWPSEEWPSSEDPMVFGATAGPTSAEARVRADRVVEGTWAVQVTVSPSHFDDIGQTVHGSAIEVLAAEGIASGCGYRRYCPAGEVTRGQAATLLSRGFDIGLPEGATPPTFTDLAPEHPHAGTIGALAAEGVMNGYPDGTVRPQAPVTRGQLAVMLARVLGLELSSDASFSDVLPGTTVSRALRALVDAGIAHGYPDGRYRPGRAVTRGEAASLLARALDLSD